MSKSVVSNTFRYYDTFFITCIIYFVMTYSITKLLRFAEKKLDGPDNYILLGNQMQVEKPEDKAKRAGR
jgi:putative lysine transport system permease protein